MGFFLQRINEKPQVVNDYEAGKAIPNQQVLSKLERALGIVFSPSLYSNVITIQSFCLTLDHLAGVKLRGKDKGQALGGSKKK